MSLREFVFVDNVRLDSYTEQIVPAVTYDKVPVYSASLSCSRVVRQQFNNGSQGRCRRSNVSGCLKTTFRRVVISGPSGLTRQSPRMNTASNDRSSWKHARRHACTFRHVKVNQISRVSSSGFLHHHREIPHSSILPVSCACFKIRASQTIARSTDSFHPLTRFFSP